MLNCRLFYVVEGMAAVTWKKLMGVIKIKDYFPILKLFISCVLFDRRLVR